MLAKHQRSVCCIPNCGKPRWTAGRCGYHERELRQNEPETVEWLKTLSSEEAEHQFYMTLHGLPLPKWEYEPSPEQTATLIKIYGSQTSKHVRIGAPLHAKDDENTREGE